jgi:hypothetical protein
MTRYETLERFLEGGRVDGTSGRNKGSLSARRGWDSAAEELGERNTLILKIISLRKVMETSREDNHRTICSCSSPGQPVRGRAGAAGYGNTAKGDGYGSGSTQLPYFRYVHSG